MVKYILESLRDECRKAGLDQSAELINDFIDPVPSTKEALRILARQVRNEMGRHLFLRVPSERAKYWECDDIVSDALKKAFPGPAKELRRASNCYAAGEFTASVFHSMRAVESGVRVMAEALKITFSEPIELIEMASVIEQMEVAIKNMKQRPRGKAKDEDLHFYSQAAAQFRYFKDGWRIRVAHAREVYEEPQALSALNHVREFFEALAVRLHEPDEARPTPS